MSYLIGVLIYSLTKQNGFLKIVLKIAVVSIFF